MQHNQPGSNRTSTDASPMWLALAIKDLSYSDRLVKFGLSCLYYRRARGDIIEMHNHPHGRYTVVTEYIKMDTGSRGRCHKHKLKKQRVTKTIRQQYFSNRVTNTWNMLLAVVTDTPSLNSFKARIGKYWYQYQDSLHSVHKAHNPKSKLERPRSDTGSYPTNNQIKIEHVIKPTLLWQHSSTDSIRETTTKVVGLWSVN